MTSSPLLSVSNLGLSLTGRNPVSLVERVSFDVSPGEVVGIVGESGSGKSLTCRAVMQLLPPNIHVTSGSATFEGKDLLAMNDRAMRQVRGREVGMIFQNPSTYLDPVMTIGDQVGESFRVRDGFTRRQALNAATELLRQVGIPDPAARAHHFPHEFSGGMRQRAMIAAALAAQPKLLIADEPTTALDVTIQAQILKLLLDLRRDLGLSIILVTHDLSVVAQTCDRVLVLYAGRIMEAAPTDALLTEPHHPYSSGLIAAQPELADPGADLPAIPGQPPGPFEHVSGCRFHPRCAMAKQQCRDTEPNLKAIAQSRANACHFWEECRPQ